MQSPPPCKEVTKPEIHKSSSIVLLKSKAGKPQTLEHVHICNIAFDRNKLNDGTFHADVLHADVMHTDLLHAVLHADILHAEILHPNVLTAGVLQADVVHTDLVHPVDLHAQVLHAAIPHDTGLLAHDRAIQADARSGKCSPPPRARKSQNPRYTRAPPLSS